MDDVRAPFRTLQESPLLRPSLSLATSLLSLWILCRHYMFILSRIKSNNLSTSFFLHLKKK
uniref:Uncharacterized protein n=1 Tax=Arundo donax TaxID=35708 RepID=A0A0A9AR49_ARUDO